MYVENKLDSTLISGSLGNDSIWNYGSYVTIDGSDGEDYIRTLNHRYDEDPFQNNVDHVTIIGGEGNDTVLAVSSNFTYIDTSEGDDFITFEGEGSIVKCGSGNDYVSCGASNAEIWCNDDNTTVRVLNGLNVDTDITTKIYPGYGRSIIDIYISRNESYSPHIEICGISGNSTVSGFNSNDALTTYSHSYTVANIGNDLIVRKGNGSVRFKDMAGQSINIDGNFVSATSTEEDIPEPEEQDTVQSEQNPNITINNYITNQYITNVTNINIVEIVENHYTYNNEYNIIQNYSPNEVVVINGEYQGIDFQGDSFFVKSSVGILEIQNCRDKFIGYSAGNSDVLAYSYLASNGGQIDGRGKNQAEIMIGADNADNQIFAGSGGSSMWGGNGGADTLTGGDGYDEFFYAMGSGADVIQNAGDNDVVNLLGVNLSQITYAEVNYSSVNLGFVDGGSLSMQSSSATGFKLEGVTYVADRSTGGWSTK